jgi:hypothetical protein
MLTEKLAILLWLSSIIDGSFMFSMSSPTYDIMKRIVQVVLPALASLYFGLAQIWGLPKTEEVIGTIAIVTTFLGFVLGISTKTYNESDAAFDGTVVVTLELNDDPEKIEQMHSVRFKVAQE